MLKKKKGMRKISDRNDVPRTPSFKWLWCCAVLFGLALSSCSNTKYLAEGEELYVAGELKLDKASKKITEKESLDAMSQAMQPKPNKKFLGARMKLAIYNRAKEPTKETGFKHWLKYKVGEPPVLLSQVNPGRTSRLLENRLNTYGHFRSHVQDSVVRKDQKARVIYKVKVAPAYLIDTVIFPEPLDRLTKKIWLTKDSTFLTKGSPYNLDVIKAERQRIDRLLKIEGYFYFNPDFIIVRVDTSIGERKCKMYVDLKQSIPPEALKYYYIGDIFVFPEYSLNPSQASARKADTLLVDSIHYITKEYLFRPKAILPSIYFSKGQIYDTRNYDITLSRLMGLGVFKFGTVRFDQDSLHDGWLTTKIFLTPFPKRSMRAELQGVVKDNGFTGPGLILSLRNRNIFRGAELFVWNFSGTYEVQLAKNLPPLQAFKFGITPQLIFPKFILPFRIKRTTSLFVPKTKIEANYTIENRQGYYNLNSFYVNYGYNWKESVTKEHSITPISINYVNTTDTTAAFNEILNANPALVESYERQFILAINYTFTFTNQVFAWKRNPVYFKGSLEFSGNAAYGLQSLFSTQKGTPENPFTIFNNAYSQYGMSQVDFRYYIKTAGEAKIATRLFVGVGIPYGNSDVFPYYKSFTAGGVSDLRGFRIRSLGPSTYYSRTIDSLAIYNQAGDIKGEINAEFRFPILGFLKGAIFTEAGNIWMHSTKLYGEEGVFRFNKFYKELAFDAGVGIRLDITYVVVRIDFAAPFRDPRIRENDGWKFDPFGRDDFGRSNTIINLGIGYPF